MRGESKNLVFRLLFGKDKEKLDEKGQKKIGEKGEEEKEEKREETSKRIEGVNAESEIIFVVCAHPDDEVLGAGATIAKYVKEGKRVKTIIFSYGELGIPLLKKRFSVETRVKESKAADSSLGCRDSLFFGIEEGKFIEKIEERETRNRLREIFEREKPSRIFTHSPDDPHPHHRAVYKTILELVDSININIEMYIFDIWNPLNFRKRNNPQLYVNVSETFKIKMNALRAFKSQWPSLVILVPQVLISAFLNGLNSECRYAEKFYKIR